MENGNGKTKMESDELVWSACIITDVQYADKDDGLDFQKIRERKYRQTMDALTYCVEDCMKKENVKCIMQLGDLLDGYSSSKGREYSYKILTMLLDKFKLLKEKGIETHHLIGNHELYNFTRTEVESFVSSYHHFSPYPGWRFVCLDPFVFSMLGLKVNDKKGENKSDPDAPDLKQNSAKCESSCIENKDDNCNKSSLNGNDSTENEQKNGVEIEHEEMKRVARDFLKTKNPNDIDNSGVNWKNGLSGAEQRFVPYNGGLGEKQTNWLIDVLKKSKEDGEKVIIFSHLPIHPDAANLDGLAWDCFEVLQILRTIGKGTVIAFFAGHDHPGGYAYDEESSTHHCTIKSPLHCNSEKNKTLGIIEAHGYLNFYTETEEEHNKNASKRQKTEQSTEKESGFRPRTIHRVELVGKGLVESQSFVLYDSKATE